MVAPNAIDVDDDPLALTFAAVEIETVSDVAVTANVERLPEVVAPNVKVETDAPFTVSLPAVATANVSDVAEVPNLDSFAAVATANVSAVDDTANVVLEPAVDVESVTVIVTSPYQVTGTGNTWTLLERPGDTWMPARRG